MSDQHLNLASRVHKAGTV